MDNYFDLRNMADAYAANGYHADAVEYYEKALEALPRSRCSVEKQQLLRPLIQRRLDRARESAKG